MTENSNNEIRTFLSHSNKDYETVRQVNVLKSESGSFFIDDNGVVQRFEPSSKIR